MLAAARVLTKPNIACHSPASRRGTSSLCGSGAKLVRTVAPSSPVLVQNSSNSSQAASAGWATRWQPARSRGPRTGLPAGTAMV